jgi:hypothetical protein
MRPTTGHYGGEIAPHLAKSYSGAPRPMKMGTTPSRFPYDAEARDALQSASLRRPAISRYASWGSLPDFAAWSGYLPDSGPLD